MPSRDIIHAATSTALVKDGWTITADPYAIKSSDLTVYADLGAERIIAAEQFSQKIAVEAKSFLGASAIREFQQALGQFELYRTWLDEFDPERTLWLAVPREVFQDFFQRPPIQLVVRRTQLAILVVDLKQHEVFQWIK